jgi:Rieske Fe-S protein
MGGSGFFEATAEQRIQPTMHDTGTSRRGFLNSLTKLVMAVIGLFILIPAFRYLLAPLWRTGGKGGFVDAGPLAEIPVGEWKPLALELLHEDGWRQTRTRHTVWVRRQGDDGKEIIALSSICPHLGCRIEWDPAKSQFLCPCHTGVFDATGKRVSGPPPRKMDRLECKEEVGRVWVRWQDFKIGVKDQIAVNV